MVSISEKEFWSKVSSPCPVEPGTRVRLVTMSDDPDPIEPGTMGTVVRGNGAQISVNWDNGRSLQLLVGIDRFEVVREKGR